MSAWSERVQSWRTSILFRAGYSLLGTGRVALPNALDRKYPNAGKEWGWQWVFPASKYYVDRITGLQYKHHLHESVSQKAVKEATRTAGPLNPPRAIRFDILLPLIYWKMVMISRRFRNCWVTKT
jgi:hypothetical protein